MVSKGILSLIIVITLLTIVISGCFENKEGLSAEQVKNSFLNAVESVASYKYTTSGSSTQMVVNESGTSVTEMLYIGNGSVDISNHDLKFEIDYSTIGKNENDQIKIYLLDNLSYTFTGNDWNLSWQTEDISSSLDGEKFWGLYSILESLAEEISNPRENNVAFSTNFSKKIKRNRPNCS